MQLITFEVKNIGISDLEKYWPHCLSFVKAGLETAQGELNSEQVFQMLQNNQASLLVAQAAQGVISAAMVVQFQQLPNYKVAHILSIGGTGVVENAFHWDNIRQWMREQGASKVQAICQAAQARLWGRFGFYEAYRYIRQDL